MRVHSPVSGMFSRTMVPVASSHVGWVITPITGALGVTGCGFITTSTEGGETHPAELVTV